MNSSGLGSVEFSNLASDRRKLPPHHRTLGFEKYSDRPTAVPHRFIQWFGAKELGAKEQMEFPT